MKFKKIFFTSALSVTALLALAGCNSKNKTSTTSNDNTSNISTTTNNNTSTVDTTTANTTTANTTTVAPTTTINTTTVAPTTTVNTTTVAPTTTVNTTTVAPTTTVNTTTVAPTTTINTTTQTTTSEHVTNASPTIYLAGDSTVKTYNDNQFIGGWGQYLDKYLDDSITVKNAAQGGRSSRSFINEGRLYDIEGCHYNFSENDGNSIGDVIKEGDFLLIQFGHNDDDTKYYVDKTKNYSTLYNRAVPLGEPDANGIYPVTPATKVSTSTLPSSYTDYASASEENSALTEIGKYGDTYYQYGDGTYKWYLKQYIDFARSKGATPILVTPVARVSFNADGTLKSGAGLHGEDFAYVKAVRQLASEEECLLIDLFDDTKNMLEIATNTYAGSLMALKPNDLVGTWPETYDAAYNNASLGCTGIEATHYNKYGAYIEAAMVAESLLELKDELAFNGEYVNFTSKIELTPEEYVDPSNLLPKSSASKIEGLLDKINPTNPNRVYKTADSCVSMIEALEEVSNINETNYLEVKEKAEAAKQEYNSLNIDVRPSVTNYSKLQDVLEKISEIELSLRPTPTKVIESDFASITETSFTSTTQLDDTFGVVATTDKDIKVASGSGSFNYGNETYSPTKFLSLGGSASFGTARYLTVNLEANATLTVVAKSSGSDERTLSIVKSTDKSKVVGSCAAGTSLTVTTLEISDSGTYYIGSSNKGIYICYVIIEYFD